MNAGISGSASLATKKKVDGSLFFLHVGSRIIKIPVDQRLYTNFQNQFKKNTKDQTERFITLERLMRAAYLHGLHEAHK